MATPATTGARIEAVEATAFSVPTATQAEEDGTLRWDSTTVVVVELVCDGVTGLGYTYCHPAAVEVIKSTLAGVARDADPLMPERSFAEMQVQVRQLGHVGVAAMAVSAVDIALWDLKARLLGVCLADALPRYHEDVAIYGSGGFTNLTPEQLAAQLREWLAWGAERVKIKVGRDAAADDARVAFVRDIVGPRAEIMVDANGAYTVTQAIERAHAFADQGVGYLEEPVTSEDLDGLAAIRRHAPPGMTIAAGEYGWNLPYFDRMLGAGAVDLLQGDVTRCGGMTNLIRLDGLCKARSLPFSAHCAPAISVHACCAMETALHIEYFYDHYRIESLLFDGAPQPHEGRLAPRRDRPGHGLALRRETAERYAINREEAR
jgi:L-alanine-DL-glutamate epimerase-like enolase superfamily enzyme